MAKRYLDAAMARAEQLVKHIEGARPDTERIVFDSNYGADNKKRHG